MTVLSILFDRIAFKKEQVKPMLVKRLEPKKDKH